MSKTIKEANSVNTGLLNMCQEIWNDYKTGKADYETLCVYKYTRKYAVQQFPKNLIAPLLLKRTEPTKEDVENFRIELNLYRYSKRGKQGMEEAKQAAMDEKTAIAVLKKKGYRVMKKTTAYIDL